MPQHSKLTLHEGKFIDLSDLVLMWHETFVNNLTVERIKEKGNHTVHQKVYCGPHDHTCDVQRVSLCALDNNWSIPIIQNFSSLNRKGGLFKSTSRSIVSECCAMDIISQLTLIWSLWVQVFKCWCSWWTAQILVLPGAGDCIKDRPMCLSKLTIWQSNSKNYAL